ncbi:hypothetical protein B0T18DRAFT_107684 [Schizothecium vesticola]|uniref:Transmembrane protein n=1 Tax=Schizothecium vesticola TaxID=314040 RepID=A0AA40F1U1_9PEZI|nr:hypothetical protein B0T18DRAFT_107684 [Schizothecium vesticola]
MRACCYAAFKHPKEETKDDIRWRGLTGFPAFLSTSHLPSRRAVLSSTGCPTTRLQHSSAVASARDGSIPRPGPGRDRRFEGTAETREVWKSLCRPKHATFFCRNASQHFPGCRTHFEPVGLIRVLPGSLFPISSILCFSLILVLLFLSRRGLRFAAPSTPVHPTNRSVKPSIAACQQRSRPPPSPPSCTWELEHTAWRRPGRLKTKFG